jgi:hypothetical protein
MSDPVSRRDFTKRAIGLSAAGVLGPPKATPPLVEVWVPAAQSLSVLRSNLRPKLLLAHLRRLHTHLEKDLSGWDEDLERIDLEGARHECRDAILLAEKQAAADKTTVWMYDLFFFLDALVKGGIDLERPFTVEYLPVRGRGKPWHLVKDGDKDKHMFCVTQRAEPAKKLEDEAIHQLITQMGKDWNRQVSKALARIACE